MTETQGETPAGWLAQWWPALVWAVVISLFSTHLFTSENTGQIIIPVLHWLFPSASPDSLAFMHHIIRKCAHFTEYFILSLLILRGIRAGRHGTKLAWAVLAIAIVAGYASLDEFHQRFVPGRTPAVTDVLIDTTGGATAQAIAALFALWFHVREVRPRED
ncbi:MAG TPA: VanZ family protein [Candidatus Acidoferrales bacterium]|jgi:VanZ family protein|nr:VanZ family protein [Candidatus Acidoferrales bacterium]